MTPNLVNLERFKKRIRNVTGPNVTITAQEARSLCNDMDNLYEYCINVQAEMIKASSKPIEIAQVELDGGDFFGSSS